MAGGAFVSVAVADFRERSRRYGFLITLASMLYMAYVFLPAKNAGYVTVDLAGWRGLYNSAWVGTSVALLTAVFLSLIGFYLVRNSIERDRSSGVGEILSTTVLPSRSYLFGKWLSNFLVLASMVAVLAVAAGVLQLVRGEDRSLDLFRLTAPFVFVTLPLMGVVAAAAVLFECVSWLRGSFGNVAWFVTWIALVVNPVMLTQVTKGSVLQWLDPAGTGVVIDRFLDAGQANIPDYDRSDFSIGINIGPSTMHTFTWAGIDWIGDRAAVRFVWLLVGAGIVMGALPFFDRFDPARGRRLRGKPRAEPPDEEPDSPRDAFRPVDLPAADGGSRAGRLNLVPIVAAELRLALKGQNRWWYGVALGLFIAGLFVPMSAARHLWPFSWLWPLAIWSGIGCRDMRHGTRDLLDSSPRPLARQFPARLIAAFLVALLTGAAAGLRMALAGDMAGFSAWLLGAFFIASFALAAGIWTGSGRFFEVVYLLLWYGGPAQGFAPLDFSGVAAVAPDPGALRTFSTASVVLLGLALLGRRRDLLR